MLGSRPHAHLLPPEVAVIARARRQRRALVRGCFLVCALVALGCGGASVLLMSSDASLAAEQARATSLISQSSNFGEVVRSNREVSEITSVQSVATAGEVSWKPFVEGLQATLPAGMVITDFTASLDTPAQQAAVSAGVLQHPHIATVKISAQAPGMTVSDWLDRLQGLQGFVDATPGAVSRDAATGHFSVQVSLHVDTRALSKRFQEKK